MRSIVYSPAAAKALARLPGDIRRRLIEGLKRYVETGAGDDRPLVGRPGWRMRVGDYGLIFDLERDTISVEKVGHRGDVYR